MPKFTNLSLELILFAAFLAAMVVQLWQYLYYYTRLAFYKEKDLISYTPPASVIICARNEEDNLIELLHFILEQDYPEFEVVVVNDCSIDNTADILKELNKKYSNLKIVTIQESKNHSHGKKVALMMGIKGAKYDHLLLTEAGCKPNSKYWLKNMMQHLNSETEIVLGYGAYEKRSGILNKITRFDTFMIALNYLSFTLAGKTYMGTGRNLAYKKSLFFKMKGFASHYHIDSGDDDLFVNEAATKHNTKIEVNINSYTISRVKKSFKEWLLYKSRQGKSFKHYNFKSKIILTIFLFSQYLFLLSFIALLILSYLPIIVLTVFLLRLIILMILYSKSMSLLSEKDLLIFSPLMELILLFFIYPMIKLSNIFNGNNKWTKANG